MERFRVYGATRTGLVRRSNEDHILLDRSVVNRDSHQLVVPVDDPSLECGMLLAVADGIGGEAGGAIASRLALAILESRFHAACQTSGSRQDRCSRQDRIDALRAAAERANAAVLGEADSEPRLARMGCTVTGVCLLSGGYLVFNAGDSRVYRFRGGALECLTRDDSMASLVVEAGAMTAEEAARSPIGHTLTNCLGSRDFQVTIQEGDPWREGDLLLACSDGLYDMVSDPHIAGILGREATLEHHGEALVEAALEGGGNDNISIILIAAEDGDG